MANRKLQTVGMSETLVINEIYLSVQGESTWAGLPCVFVRLTACNLRCSYCDTAYAFTEGREMALPEILARVGELAKPFASRCGAAVPAASSEGVPPGARCGGETPPELAAGTAAPQGWLPLVELT